jgi:hypothetical protein
MLHAVHAGTCVLLVRHSCFSKILLALVNSVDIFFPQEAMLSQERQAQFKITSSGSLQGFLIWVEASLFPRRVDSQAPNLQCFVNLVYFVTFCNHCLA